MNSTPSRKPIEIKAEKRNNSKKNLGRKSLLRNRIVAIIYDKDENQKIFLIRNEFKKVFARLQPNDIVLIDVEGKTYKTFVKSCDYFERTGELRHVDFYNVAKKTHVTMRVPFEVVGLPAGVKKGGSLKKFVDALTVYSKTEAIPANITANVEHLEIDESLIVADMPESKAYKILDLPQKRIVSVLVTRTATKKSDEESAAEPSKEAIKTTVEEKKETTQKA